MDLTLVDNFAHAHPYYFAAATCVGGFLFKTFILTKENARRAVRSYFNWQRKQMIRAGWTPAEVKAAMQEEADFLLSAAQEAKDEAEAEGKSGPATLPATPPAA